MQNGLLLILQTCDTIKDLNNEFNKPFGWIRFKSKKEFKKLKSQIVDKIYELENDKWDVTYLRSLEETLLAYKTKLDEYFNEVYIQDYDKFEYNPKIFKPIYFSDLSKARMFILDIIADNITFVIMDTINGNTFSVSSSQEVQSSQKKIEKFCKQKIIEMLLNYLDGITGQKNRDIMEKISTDYSLRK